MTLYLGFGHYGATHGSKWIRSQPDADGWFTLVMAHGHQGTRQFLTALSTKCTIISGTDGSRFKKDFGSDQNLS